VCKIEVNDTNHVTENVEDTYYHVPITDDGQWEDLESWMGPEDLIMADPYKEFYDASRDKKTDDAGLNDWLELHK
jgi:hypothetical protein